MNRREDVKRKLNEMLERAEGELKIIKKIDFGFRTTKIEKMLKSRIETLKEILEIFG